jgi:hydroxymethylbilane synthase
VFIKEVEAQLVEKKIDIAVHSFKDITADLHSDCQLTAYLHPESQRDALVCKSGSPFSMQTPPKRIGTGSLRRRALLKRMWPDAEFFECRGNVETRIRKCDLGELDAIMLSEAGLIRLNLSNRVTYAMDPFTMTPAPGQGVIAVETRKEDTDLNTMIRRISNPAQHLKSTVEFELLSILGLGCQAPLGVFSVVNKETYRLRVFCADPDLNPIIQDDLSWPLAAALQEVKKYGHQLKERLSRVF